MNIKPWIVVALAGSLAVVSISYDLGTSAKPIEVNSIKTSTVLTDHLLLTSSQVFNTALLHELPTTLQWNQQSVPQVGKALNTVWDKGVLPTAELASLTFEMENMSGEQLSQYLAGPHLQAYKEVAKKEHWQLKGDMQSTALAPASDQTNANTGTQ